MANAEPNDHIHAEEIIENDIQDVDDEIDEDDEQPGSSKQNGTAYVSVDRYGFIGGDQYTNPDKYVSVVCRSLQSLVY